MPVAATCAVSCALMSSTAPSAAASAAVCASVEKIAARPTWKNSTPNASSDSMITISKGTVWPSWRRSITGRNVTPRGRGRSWVRGPILGPGPGLIFALGPFRER